MTLRLVGRAIVAFGGVGLAVLASATAQAATLHVASPVKAGYLDLPGAAYAVEGVTTGSLHGAASWHETGAGSSFSGSFLYVDGHGTMRGTSHGTQQPPAGTSIAFSDTITITRGTGAYRGAKGTLTSTGSADTQTGDITEKLVGTLKIGRPAPRPRPLTRASAYHATMSVIAATTGSTVTAVGTVHGLTPPGGIIVLHSPQGAEVTETYTYYDGLGTISGSFRLVRTPQPDGTLTLTTKPGGTAHGTGRYARVTGLASTSFNGSRDPTTGVVTITLTGRLRLSP